MRIDHQEMHRFSKKSFGLRGTLIVFILLLSLNAWSAFGEDQQGKAAEDPKLKRLTLTDCVMLALQNNVAIKAAYLDRISQRMALRVAEDKFTPQPSLTFSTRTASTYNADNTRTQATTRDGAFMATLTIPTGGTFSFTWDNPVTRSDAGKDYNYGSGWNVTFIQPILKNAGIDAATQSVRQAQVAEEQYVLDLRDTLSATVTTTISQYRDYVSALRNHEIQIKGLETAKQTLEINKALIEAGRMAGTEILQTQNDIANRELSVITAKNSIDSGLLALLQTLNLDKNTMFMPVEEPEKRVTLPPLNDAMTIALKNRTDYIKAVQNRELAELDLTVKRRGLLWDLSLFTAVGRTGAGDTYRSAFSDQQVGKSDWNAGLILNIPLRDLATQGIYVSAQVALEKANLYLKKLTADIEMDVHSKLRDVDVNYRSYLLAMQGRELSEQKLAIEQEKLKLGRTTNFQIISYQNDVRNQRTSELQALITYFNSLTALDQSLGATLNRWNISVRREDHEVNVPEEVKKTVVEKKTAR